MRPPILKILVSLLFASIGCVERDADIGTFGGQSGGDGQGAPALGDAAGSMVDVATRRADVMEGLPGAGGRPGPTYSCDSSQVASAYIRVSGQRPLIATLAANNCGEARCTPEAKDAPCAVAHVASHLNAVGPCVVTVTLTDGRKLQFAFSKVPNPDPMSFRGCTLQPFILNPYNVEIPAEATDGGGIVDTDSATNEDA